MRVFITGDVHQSVDIHKLNEFNFPVKNLTKEDILIICGDAGFVFYDDERDDKWIQWISNRPWTTVFVDGNHENHKALKKFEVVDFHNAKAHKISDSLYHILRGEIMSLNGDTYFCFGGAFSHDIEFRTENVSWWQDELPVQEEIDNALDHLEAVNYQVDYVITHDIPTKANIYMGYHLGSMHYYDHKYINICQFFQNIYEITSFKKWFAGHYHTHRKIFDNIQLLYSDIVEITSYAEIFLNNNIRYIRNHRYSIDEIKEQARKDNLYISGRTQRIGRKEDFFSSEPKMPLIDFFDQEVTKSEYEDLLYLFRKYMIKKDT